MKNVDIQIIGSSESMLNPNRTPVAKDYWLKPGFDELRREWYGKLKEYGFKDIEPYESEYVASSQEFNKNNLGEQNGSGPEYHEYCHLILRTFKFRRDMHKDIFEKHTEGMATPDISKWLDTHPLHKPMTFKAIANLIDRIKQDHARG